MNYQVDRTTSLARQSSRLPSASSAETRTMRVLEMRGGGLEPDGGARQAWIFQEFTSASIRR
jgi:hypothetical protein